MIEFPNWFDKTPEYLRKKIEREADFLIHYQSGRHVGSPKANENLYFHADKALSSIYQLQNALSGLINDSGVLFAGDYQTNENLQATKDILGWAAKHDMEKPVLAGMDLFELQWVLLGAEHKISEVINLPPTKRTIGRPSVYWKARVEIEITKAMVDAGCSKEQVEIILECIFVYAKTERVSSKSLKRLETKPPSK